MLIVTPLPPVPVDSVLAVGVADVEMRRSEGAGDLLPTGRSRAAGRPKPWTTCARHLPRGRAGSEPAVTPPRALPLDRPRRRTAYSPSVARVALRSTLGAFALFGALTGACTGSAPSIASGECEAREVAYRYPAVFPFEEQTTIDMPECRPRCGAVRSAGGFFQADALPAGPCQDAPSCQMPAHGLCPCPTDHGAVNGYRCDCRGGSWACVITSAGGAICPRRGDPTLPSACEAGAP